MFGTADEQADQYQRLHAQAFQSDPTIPIPSLTAKGALKAGYVNGKFREWIRNNVPEDKSSGQRVGHLKKNLAGFGKPEPDSDSESDGNARGPRYVDAEFLEQWPPHMNDEAACHKQMREAHELYKRRAISRGTLSKILYLNEAYMLGHGPKSIYFLRGKNDGFPALSTTYLTRPPAGGEESKVGMVKAHLQGKKMPADMAKLYLGLEVEGRGTKRARE